MAPTRTDRALAILIARQAARTWQKKHRPRPRRFAPGPRALSRLSTAQLTAETYRRLGERDGHLNDRDRRHLADEYNRRGFDTTAEVIRGAAVGLATAAGLSLAAERLSDVLSDDATEFPERAAAVEDGFTALAAAEDETGELDVAVVPEDMTAQDYADDLRDVGADDQTAQALAFADEYGPSDLAAAIAEQQADTSADADTLQSAATSSMDHSDAEAMTL